MGMTMSRLPVPCEGSATMGRWESLLKRDCGDVHGVAGCGFVSADAAFAKHDVVVAAGEDVFAGEEELLDGAGDAAFEEDGFADLAELAQQIEVLHVARADLEEVGVGEHGLDLRDLHDLADGEQAVRACGFVHELEAGDAEALKCVGRGAGFECAAAQEFSAGGFNAPRGLVNLASFSMEQGPAMTATVCRRSRRRFRI